MYDRALIRTKRKLCMGSNFNTSPEMFKGDIAELVAQYHFKLAGYSIDRTGYEFTMASALATKQAKKHGKNFMHLTLLKS